MPRSGKYTLSGLDTRTVRGPSGPSTVSSRASATRSGYWEIPAQAGKPARYLIRVKMDLSPARGTRDLLPAAVAVRDHVLARIAEVYLRGEAGMLAEIELIEATTEALGAAGISDTVVRLSDRRFLAALAANVGLPESAWDGLFITLDKLDKIGWDGVRTELAGRGLSAGAVGTPA